MTISFITTIFNESGTIGRFLDSVYSQTKLPDEIIIVDGGSTDDTVSKIKDLRLKIKEKKVIFKLFIKKGNRSVGRNEAIKHATGDIIVCSDSGNILDKNWIKNITEPFHSKQDSSTSLRFSQKDNGVDVVAGYYEGMAKNVFQKSLVPYALVMPDRVDPNNFLPATRSIAFTKAIWKKVGGFNEKLSHNEDYVFAKALKKLGANIIFKKDAIVYWLPRDTIKEAYIMFFRFAYGDAEARILRPKVLLIFIRYFIIVGFLVLSIFLPSFYASEFFIVLILLYSIWAISKNYRYVKDVRAFFWLPIIQFTADVAVIKGTSLGLFKAKIW